jgi:hypothetical protein
MKDNNWCLTLLAIITTLLGIALFVEPQKSLASQVKSSSATGTINKFLQQTLPPLPPEQRTESYKKLQGAMKGLEKWMGSYQNVRKSGDGYSAVFKNGYIPIKVEFKADQSVGTFVFSGCPVGKSLSIKQSPSNMRSILAKCPNLKP